MTEQQTPTSEVLNRAADLIQERGWVSGPEGWPDSYLPANSPLCIEGGLLAAQGLTSRAATSEESGLRTCPAYVAVMAHLATDDRWRCSSDWVESGNALAYEWNDAPGRTAAEVIEVLRAAAAIEQAREADHTLTIEPLDADGRGTGECELTAEQVAS